MASFGTLSKLYNNMNDFNLMKRVARDFDMPQHEYLRSWLESLTKAFSRIENGKNLTLSTIVRYLKALGAKTANLDLGSMGRVALW